MSLAKKSQDPNDNNTTSSPCQGDSEPQKVKSRCALSTVVGSQSVIKTLELDADEAPRDSSEKQRGRESDKSLTPTHPRVGHKHL